MIRAFLRVSSCLVIVSAVAGSAGVLACPLSARVTHKERGAFTSKALLTKQAGGDACAPSTGNFVSRGNESKPVVVRVNAETVAHNDRVTLGDIAQIRGSSSTTERLKEISLGYAPEVGAIRKIAKEKIALALAAAGFPQGTVNLEGPAFATIRRASQTVDLAKVQEAVERATLSQLEAFGATAKLVKLELPKRIEVQTGSVEIRALPGTQRNLFSPFTVSIEIWVDGRIVKRIAATAQVEAYATVVVAAANLAEKVRVRAEDFRIEKCRLERETTAYIYVPDQLRGVTLARSVAEGQPITRDQLVPDIVVKVGDVVRIIAESGTLQIGLTAEARASGHVGDRIQVKNLQSGISIQAIVVDEGIVKIRF